MTFNTTIKNIMVGFIPFLLGGLSHTSILVLTIFLIVDVLTGIIASVRVDGIRKLSSRTLSFGILFKFLILLVPLIVVWTGIGIGIDLLVFAVWSINMLIVSEALSILGNISTIKTGQHVQEVDAVNIVFKKIRKLLISFLERETTNNK